MPYLTYRRISTPQDYAHTRLGNPTPGPTGYQRPRFQLDGWAETFEGIREIATQARAALSGYVGMMGAVEVRSCRMVTEMDTYDSDAECHRTIIDVIIGYKL